jgi:hypothetical protein
MSVQVATSESAASSVMATPSQESAPTNQETAARPGITTADDLAKLRAEGKPLTLQELKDLNTKVKAYEEMARIEDRLRTLEDRKRTYEAIDTPFDQSKLLTGRLSSSSGHSTHLASYQASSTPEQDGSDSSDTTYHHLSKRPRYSYSRGIKVTPSYTLTTGSSLREWGDWKRDIERVFQGDPQTYQTGSQKVLKALDYLDASLKSLWYTYSEQKGEINRWSSFVTWTRENIQNGQNATATLYEQLNAAKLLPERSPVQFNAYLSAIERDLPQQDDKASAMAFYSKLTRELKRQFKTSDIAIPETRAQCVAVAQRVWEGLYCSEGRKSQDFKRNDKPYDRTSTGSKYPRPDSTRDRKDRYRTSHRREERRSSETSKRNPPDVVCYTCQKPGHYSTSCPQRREHREHKERRSEAKIQSVQQHPEGASPSPSPSSRTGSEEPTARSLSPDSDSDSSN